MSAQFYGAPYSQHFLVKTRYTRVNARAKDLIQFLKNNKEVNNFYSYLLADLEEHQKISFVKKNTEEVKETE